MKKKFFAKLALCLALILVLTSCAGNAPQLLDFLGNMASDIDFGGMEFRVLSHADAGEGPQKSRVKAEKTEKIF